jgi:hypothetical protein
MAADIRAQSGRAPEPRHLVLLDGEAHAQNIFTTDQGPRLTGLILDFLAGAAPVAAADSIPPPSTP